MWQWLFFNRKRNCCITVTFLFLAALQSLLKYPVHLSGCVVTHSRHSSFLLSLLLGVWDPLTMPSLCTQWLQAVLMKTQKSETPQNENNNSNSENVMHSEPFSMAFFRPTSGPFRILLNNNIIFLGAYFFFFKEINTFF